MAQTTCQHPDGCTRRGRIKRGWCPMHYQRVMDTGDPGPVGSYKQPYGSQSGMACTVDGCERPMRAALLCDMHYKRVQTGRDLGPAQSLRREMPPESKSWTPGERHRFYKYGLTPRAFNELLDSQHGRCYICGTTEPVGLGWSVDHCHETNVVRFIACNPCNAALGLIREDPDIAWRLWMVANECQARKTA